MSALNFAILLKFPHFLSRLTTREVTLVNSVFSDNHLVLFHLRWKETRLTDKKFQSILCSEAGSVKTYVKKVTTSLGFYSNQFWSLPKLSGIHKTLKSISFCKSLNYCASASGNHDLPFNHQLKKCHSISNPCEWNFIGLSKWSGVL